MAKFNIISQFLKDISFESPNVPELFFKSDNGQAKLEINIDIQIKGADNNLSSDQNEYQAFDGRQLIKTDYKINRETRIVMIQQKDSTKII